MGERLTRQQRQQRFDEARGIGSQICIDARGNHDFARSLVHERLQDAGYGSVWVLILARIIFALLEWWFLQGITDPGDTPLADEPTADDMEFDA